MVESGRCKVLEKMTRSNPSIVLQVLKSECISSNELSEILVRCPGSLTTSQLRIPPEVDNPMHKSYH